MKLVITVGMDVALNRIEVEVVGWVASSGSAEFLKDSSRRFRIVTAAELAKDELPGGFDSGAFRDSTIRTAAMACGMSVPRYKLLLEKQRLRAMERELAEYEKSERKVAKIAKSLTRAILTGDFSKNCVCRSRHPKCRSGRRCKKDLTLDEAIRFVLVSGPGDELEILGRTDADRLTLPLKDVPLLAEALRQFKKTDPTTGALETICPCLSGQICGCGKT